MLQSIILILQLILTNMNMVLADRTSYKPSLIYTLDKDHRDYMVYIANGVKHTIGAGMTWDKSNTGSIRGC